jgi:hypothetical protein
VTGTASFWAELPTTAQDAISKRFPGLTGPRAPAVVWKGQEDPTTGLTQWTAFEAGRLLATISA